MIHEGETYGLTRDRVTVYDNTVVTLPLDQLREVRDEGGYLSPQYNDPLPPSWYVAEVGRNDNSAVLPNLGENRVRIHL